MYTIKLNLYFTLLSIFVGFSVSAQKIVNQTFYENPVIPGDFPDPTVIRVDGTYYAAGTSSNFAPHYPLFESKDLVNWKQIGYIFNELPSWASASFWAPELYYMNGTFFVYYTAKRKTDQVSCIGVATTKNIYNGFQDHGILIEWGSEAIDAFVFRDDDEKLYISWKAYGLTKDRPIELLCSELSQDGLHLIGEHFTLTDHDAGWQGAGDEGQCLVKHGAYYYLFYSVGGCCGNRCSYQLKVARSKNLRQGWEQKAEPIIQGGNEWVCTGHGTLVTTPDHRYFYLYHSYNVKDFEYIGRQGLLDEIVWDEKTLWPKLKHGDTPSVKAETPFQHTIQQRDTILQDDFNDNNQAYRWQWSVYSEKPTIQYGKGELHLLSTNNDMAFIGLRPKTGDYNFTVGLTNQPRIAKGIVVYGHPDNRLAFIKKTGQIVVYIINAGKKTILASINSAPKESIYLRLTATHGRYFQFFYSQNQEDWLSVKVGNDYIIDGQFLPAWDTAMRIGLIVEGKPGNKGTFSEMEMKYEF